MAERDKARFAAKFAALPSGCWKWSAATDQDGYGVFHLDGRSIRAHRAALILSGHAIPDGMVVDHACRNRWCVNPGHLRVVDNLTNVTENTVSPPFFNKLKTHCSNGHELAGNNVIQRYGKRKCRACHNQGLRDYRLRKKGECPPGPRVKPEEPGAACGTRPNQSGE